MYEDLIQRLRDYRNWRVADAEKHIPEAADALEAMRSMLLASKEQMEADAVVIEANFGDGSDLETLIAEGAMPDAWKAINAAMNCGSAPG